MEKVNGDPFIDDLLIEILLRLPLKPLFALKSVSKRWYRIISSPHFQQRYQFQRNEQDDYLSSLLGFFQSGEQGSFIPISPQLSGIVHFKLYGDLLIGSSNGLLLYYNNFFMVYRICNLITREWLSLPPSHNHINNAMGFDVEGISDQDCKLEKFKFKVVCIVLSSLTCPSTYLQMEVFSSENKIWVEYTLVASIGSILLRPFEYAVVINGVYYWWERLNRVVAYDSNSSQELVDNTITVHQLPERNIGTIERSFVLGKSKDGLLQYGISDSFKIVIWVLDGIGECNWILRHTVSFMFMCHQYPDIMSSCDLILDQEALRNERNANVPELVALHPLNPDVVFIQLNKTILCYCLYSGCLKIVQLHGNNIMTGERRLPYLQLQRCKRLFPYFLPTWASFSTADCIA